MTKRVNFDQKGTFWTHLYIFSAFWMHTRVSEVKLEYIKFHMHVVRSKVVYGFPKGVF
jgi:hypothetical protein